MKQAPCPRCRTLVRPDKVGSHFNSKRCDAAKLANDLRARGLHTYGGDVVARAPDAALALTLFGFDAEVHNTKMFDEKGQYRGGIVAQAWSTRDGIGIVEACDAASRTKLLGLSFPETARRFHADRKTLALFDTARRLGASNETLLKLLKPVDYVIGSDGVKRPQKRFKPFGVNLGPR